jgi:hypothetical protein
MIVWGEPFFFEADQSFVGFPANFSRNSGRLSRIRGLLQDVVSRMAVTEDAVVNRWYGEEC